MLVPCGRAAQTGKVVGWGSQVIPLLSPGARFTKIAAGDYHSLALKVDGTVVAWGWNYFEQCVVPVGLSGVVAIAAGGGLSLALKSDGTVVAWSRNFGGESEVPTELSGVVSIAAGGAHSLALKGDGTVAAWGFNNDGQCIVPTGLSGVIAIAAGYNHSLALKSDGTVLAWGNNISGQSSVPNGLHSVVSVSAGNHHSLALRSDGTVVGWGAQSDPQNTVPIGLNGVVAIAAGGSHGLALKSDGKVVAWGQYYFGQGAVPANLSEVVAIAAGIYQSLALKRDGTVVTWSNDYYGRNTTYPLSLSGIVGIAAGSASSLGLNLDGTVIGWGQNNGGGNVPTDLSGVVAISMGGGSASPGSLALKSDGSVTNWGGSFPTPENLNDIIAIAGGSYNCLALKSNSTVIGWSSSGSVTVPTNLSDVIAIAAGYHHSLALKSDGTVVGWAQFSTYGEGTVPTNLRDVIAIAAGEYHSLALKSDGTVIAWGAGQEGQTGGDNRGQSVVPVNLSGVIAIAAGEHHSLALKSNGKVIGWGDNTFGQTSVPSGLENVFAIGAGGRHSLALVKSGNEIPLPIPPLTVPTDRLATIQECGVGTVPTDNRLKTFADGDFRTSGFVFQNRMTIVLTHGWNSDPNVWAKDLASRLHDNLSVTPNIVAWDWQKVAGTPEPFSASTHCKGEGEALARALIQALGPNYDESIHFAGHSLGTLVNAAAANYLHKDITLFSRLGRPATAEGSYQAANTHITLFDEAELAPKVVNYLLSKLTAELTGVPLSVKFFSDDPVPKHAAWADNYLSAAGLFHNDAVNLVLTSGLEEISAAHGFDALWDALRLFHGYPCLWYTDSVDNPFASALGNRWAFERSGFSGAPQVGSVYVQSYVNSHLNVALADKTVVLRNYRDRLSSLATGLGYNVVQSVKDGIVQVNGAIQTAVDYVGTDALVVGPIGAFGLQFKLRARAGNISNALKPGGQKAGAGGEPIPNEPAYMWGRLNVPVDATDMSFDFMLEGEGSSDLFAAAINGTNLFSLETGLIETNILMNSGPIDVRQWAGQEVELFFGIYGGASTNATVTVNALRFYSVLPPSLKAGIAGNNSVLTWPLWATNYVLEMTVNLSTTNTWITVTNEPSIFNLQNSVTDGASAENRFFRLRKQ